MAAVDNSKRDPVDPTVTALMGELEKAAREQEYIKRKVPKTWISLFDALNER